MFVDLYKKGYNSPLAQLCRFRKNMQKSIDKPEYKLVPNFAEIFVKTNETNSSKMSITTGHDMFLQKIMLLLQHQIF